jgi:hypothetical protein
MAAPLRFLVHLLPTSAAPSWMGWPLEAPVQAAATPTGWYAWRLITPNNRELARSVFRFAAPDLCRRAVLEVQHGAARIVISTVADPLTGQFTWRAELDGRPVAAGKRYEYEQGARYATKKFLGAVATAQIATVVRGLRDRRTLEGER